MVPKRTCTVNLRCKINEQVNMAGMARYAGHWQRGEMRACRHLPLGVPLLDMTTNTS